MEWTQEQNLRKEEERIREAEEEKRTQEKKLRKEPSENFNGCLRPSILREF